jgi:crotonobetainyl-CoA:carnitine CoA-transferase CaiB-like acyl-CoA transferase
MIVVVAHQDHHFERFCKAIEKPEWAQDPRFAMRPSRLENRAILIPMIETHLQTRNGDEWLEKIHKAGVPAGPINTLDRVLNDPQVLAREMVAEMEGPLENAKIKTIGNPIKMSHTPIKEPFSSPPGLGEHTREILEDLLGYPKEKLMDLNQKGVIRLS